MLHAYRALYMVGSPWARLLTAVLWCFVSLGAEAKRVLLALIGWQSQKLTRRGSTLGHLVLPDLRNWHISLGARLAASSPQRT